MNIRSKIILALAGVGCVGMVVFGIATIQTVKENEVKEAAGIVQIEVQDSTEGKTEVEQIVEQSMEDTYRKEAEALWQQHSEELICTAEVFVDKYIDYRNNGLTSEQAWNSLFNEFAKENQVQFNEAGEAVAEPSDMDILITQEPDENMDEPVVEEPEVIETVDFVVEDIIPCQLYAISAVNVRQGPDANEFDKISSLKQNQRVTVTGIVKQYKDETCLWYRLEGSQGNIGYVSGAYLAENPVGSTTNQSESTTTENQSGNTNTENTNTGNNSSAMDKLNQLMQNSTPLNGAAGGQADADHGGNPNINLQ